MIIPRRPFHSTTPAELATPGLKQGYLRITGAHQKMLLERFLYVMCQTAS